MNVDEKKLYESIAFLTSIRPFRNYENTYSLDKVAEYIRGEIDENIFEVSEEGYNAANKYYKNIVASYDKAKQKRLIIGAHYDVCGDTPGADDNASAVASLLETARLIGESSVYLDYGIDIVFYSLEEPPFFGTEKMGSFIHAKGLYENKTEVIGMICYEMLGYFSEEDNSQNYPDEEIYKSFPNVGNFLAVAGGKNSSDFTKRISSRIREKATVDIIDICLEEDNELLSLSDNRNYSHFGFNALMLTDTAFLRNPNYHKSTDTIDTLNFSKMAGVVLGCYNGAINAL